MPRVRPRLSRVPPPASPAECGSPRRAGFTLAEAIAAMVVLSALLLTLIPLVLRVQQGLPGLIHRQQALLIASNLLDELTRREAEELALGEWPLTALPPYAQPEELQRHIPGATVRVAVEAETEPPARRVWVTIEWPRLAGQPTERIGLSAWVPAATRAAAHRSPPAEDNPGAFPLQGLIASASVTGETGSQRDWATSRCTPPHPLVSTQGLAHRATKGGP